MVFVVQLARMNDYALIMRRNVSYFNGKTRELRCETRLPYTKKPRNNNNKNTIDI